MVVPPATFKTILLKRTTEGKASFHFKAAMAPSKAPAKGAAVNGRGKPVASQGIGAKAMPAFAAAAPKQVMFENDDTKIIQ